MQEHTHVTSLRKINTRWPKGELSKRWKEALLDVVTDRKRARLWSEEALPPMVYFFVENAPHQHFSRYSVEATAPKAIALGSHESVDVFVPDGSLRHAALLLWPHAEDGKHLQLIDLRSTDGLKVWGHDVEGQLEAQKVFQVALGATHITCVWLYDDEDALLDFNTLQELTAEEDYLRRPVHQIVKQSNEPKDVSKKAVQIVEYNAADDDDASMLDEDAESKTPSVMERSAVVSCYSEVSGISEREQTRVASVHLHAENDEENPRKNDDGEGKDEKIWQKAYLRVCRSDFIKGALIGRYERCMAASISMREDGFLSRVHALVIEKKGMLWLLDAGSTNGTLVFDVASGETLAELDDELRLWPLQENEGIRVGSHEAIFVLDDDEMN